MADHPSQTFPPWLDQQAIEASGGALPFTFEEWSDLDFEHTVTEDDEPVDNLVSARNQRLLVEPLYSAWSPPAGVSCFLADANIGVFFSKNQPPLVPDAFLSLGVQAAENWWEKRHRSYFIQVFGKPPDVVVEIVSNREGEEDTRKLRLYASIGVTYYAIFDPLGYLRKGTLRLFSLQNQTYYPIPGPWLPQAGVGLTLWTGSYEGNHYTWLRWCDQNGVVIPTGKELSEQAEQKQARAEQERAQALAQMERAEQERAQTLAQMERMAARLRELGLDPENLEG